MQHRNPDGKSPTNSLPVKARANRHGLLYHAARFYGLSLVLAYGLFHLLPRGYVWAGFGYTESLLLVVATINVHHFIVDGFIWRLGRGGSNRRIVDEGLATAA